MTVDGIEYGFVTGGRHCPRRVVGTRRWSGGRGMLAVLTAMIVSLSLLVAGCDQGESGKDVGFEPLFLPLKFTFLSDGSIKVSGTQRIVTPIGTFSLSDSMAKPREAAPDRTLLIIRHNVGGTQIDDWFDLASGNPLRFVVDGVIQLTAEGNVAVLEILGPATGVVVEDHHGDAGAQRLSAEQVPSLPDISPGIDVTPQTVQCDAAGVCDSDVTITSTGSGVLQIGDIELIGPGASYFVYGAECENVELANNETCVVSVEFTPPPSGEAVQAVLLIHQNLPGPANEVTLTGVDTAPAPEPGIDVTPQTVQCDAAGVCDSDVTITSTGSGVLQIGDIELIGPGASYFVYGGECVNVELANGDTCVVSMGFTPPPSGEAVEATLRIHQNLPGPANDVTLTG